MSQAFSQFVSTPSIEVMLIIGRAVALVLGFLVLAWALSHWRRNAQRDTQRVFEQLDLVRSELLIMKEVMRDSAQRVERPTINQPLAPQPVMTGPARGYEIAARMARNGAGKDELIRSCGITAHEAELLIKLHSRDARPAQPTVVAKPEMAAANNVAASIGRQPRPTTTAEPARSAAPQQPAPRANPKVRSRLVAVG
jgi:hypothetical protein